MLRDNLSTYQLLDSGAGLKLEQFGEYKLVRPCSSAVWAQRLSSAEWNLADAEYDPKSGWSFSKAKFSEWQLSVTNTVKLILRLQDNGQVGFFPEHLVPHDLANDYLAASDTQHLKTLNLFAYTGLITLMALACGSKVTHVDISARALEWLHVNVSASGLEGQAKDKLRCIKEDALSFLKKELRREQTYDLIIADPPNFSRIDRKKTWALDAVLKELLDTLVGLLNPQRGLLLVSSHIAHAGAETTANLLHDAVDQRLKSGSLKYNIQSQALSLKEYSSPRTLPAGSLVSLTFS
jgi:23S rRNA (cytosine1962-C5)-methyltransferase